MHNTYMVNKTISLPEDVVAVIDSLDMPFSRWVTEQLRLHAAKTTLSFGDNELLADAALAVGDKPPSRAAVAKRMDQSAPW